MSFTSFRILKTNETDGVTKQQICRFIMIPLAYASVGEMTQASVNNKNTAH